MLRGTEGDRKGEADLSGFGGVLNSAVRSSDEELALLVLGPAAEVEDLLVSRLLSANIEKDEGQLNAQKAFDRIESIDSVDRLVHVEVALGASCQEDDSPLIAFVELVVQNLADELFLLWKLRLNFLAAAC